MKKYELVNPARVHHLSFLTYAIEEFLQSRTSKNSTVKKGQLTGRLDNLLPLVEGNLDLTLFNQRYLKMFHFLMIEFDEKKDHTFILHLEFSSLLFSGWNIRFFFPPCLNGITRQKVVGRVTPTRSVGSSSCWNKSLTRWPHGNDDTVPLSL